MRALIFANGALNDPQDARKAIQPDDLVIAADGGLHHLLALAHPPDVLIGDLDSLTEDEVGDLDAAGAEIVRHPVRKDATDLEIAVRFALERGAGEVVIFGAVGGRWDQSLANLLLAASADLTGAHLRVVDGPQEVQLVRAGETLEIEGQAGDTVSLIPLLGEARGITTSGLAYPLQGGTLRFGSTRGISNTLEGAHARVHLEEGMLICAIIHGPVRPVEGR